MSKLTKITGRAIPVVGDDIDTDRIIPARYLKEITFSKMGDYPFFDERFNADGIKKDHPFNKPEYQGAQILIGNVNFGCGSSREHAPQSLVRWGNPQQPGIKAVVAESFAEIFACNCVMLGTPAVTASKADIQAMQKIAQVRPDLEWQLDLQNMMLKVFTPIPLGSIPELDPIVHQIFNVKMPDTRRKALLEGTWDSTGLLMENADLVKENAKNLPYMNAYA
jgi:3-isopropylmalate/(R)-2-methylmalate dehydratase small subunit